MFRSNKTPAVSLFAIGLALLAFVSLAAPAQAQQPLKERNIIESQYTGWNPCTGEDMDVTEKFQLTFSSVPGSDGCSRFQIHVNSMGSSAVSQSGAKYQLNSTMNSQQTFCDGCILDATFTNATVYAGQGKAPNFRNTSNVRFIINWCEGTFTVVRDNWKFSCD